MLLITGATGRVGGELVRAIDKKDTDYRILVRDVDRARTLPERAERVVADLGEPATLPAAFDGVTKLFLMVPGVGLEHTTHALTAAKTAGVEHIVLLSSYNALGEPVPAMGRWHHSREEMIRASGIPFTFLRPTGFMTNTLEWLPTLRERGFVFDPTGPGRNALIDPADIAAVASLTLSDDSHRGQEYLLTGPEALTVAEQVAILARVIGRPIEVRVASTPEDALRFRYPQGAPPPLADALISGLADARADTVGVRTNTVEHLLGHPPSTFVGWCARNADAFLRPRSP